MMKRKYRLKPKAKVFIALIGILYFSIVFLKQEIKMRRQWEEANNLRQQIAQVDEMNKELERMIKYTESEDYIERMARERLGWVKDDEIKFVEKKNN